MEDEVSVNGLPAHAGLGDADALTPIGAEFTLKIFGDVGGVVTVFTFDATRPVRGFDMTVSGVVPVSCAIM